MFHVFKQLLYSLRKVNSTQWTAEGHCYACGLEAFLETQVLHVKVKNLWHTPAPL